MTRAAVLQIFHEANAFSPLRVTRADFLIRHHLQGDAVRAAFGATRNWMGGVLSALDAAGVETTIGLCTAALPGGPVEASSWDTLRSELLGSLDSIVARAIPDHVFLLLHGALCADGVYDPEGDLACDVRARIGPNTRLSVALDFHANVGPGLIQAADLVLGGKLYPHTDTRERGARLVELALTEVGIKTRHFLLDVQVPMPRQVTTEGPFADLVALTNRLEAATGVLDVTLLGGFPFSYAPFSRTSLLVTATTDAITRQARDCVSAALMQHREALVKPIPDLAEGMANAEALAQHGRVVLVDVGDNPGGGGLGDRTHLLPYLESLGRPYVFGALVQPNLVAAAWDAAPGGPVSIEVPGGTLRAKVISTTHVRYRNVGAMMRGEELDGGPGAVLHTGCGFLLVTTHRIQAYDTQAFTSVGIDLDAAKVIAIKSIGHFRASYTPLATGGIILIDSGGYSSPKRHDATALNK